MAVICRAKTLPASSFRSARRLSGVFRAAWHGNNRTANWLNKNNHKKNKKYKKYK